MTASFNVPVTGFEAKHVKAPGCAVENFQQLSPSEWSFEVKKTGMRRVDR